MNAVTKWGNSLALRLPKPLADSAHLSVGTPVDMRVEDGRLVISAAKPKYKLDDLLRGHKPEYNHTDSGFGGPVGEEIW